MGLERDKMDGSAAARIDPPRPDPLKPRPGDARTLGLIRDVPAAVRNLLIMLDSISYWPANKSVERISREAADAIRVLYNHLPL